MSTAIDSVGAGFAPSPALPAIPIPPLETGDRLTRAEFRRRWEAMPHVKHAELIEGIVFMGAAAIRHRQHGRPYRILIGWLDRYVANTPGLDGGGNASVGLDEDNEPQPDGYLFLPPALGSKTTVTDDGYIEGPPDLIAEVSASTTSIDLNLKFNVYRRSGVREYLVWRVLDKEVDWFALRDGQYVRLSPDADGVLRSRVFPGLWLDPDALVKRQLKRLHAVLDEGWKTAEYIEFAKRVAQFEPPEDT